MRSLGGGLPDPVRELEGACEIQDLVGTATGGGRPFFAPGTGRGRDCKRVAALATVHIVEIVRRAAVLTVDHRCCLRFSAPGLGSRSWPSIAPPFRRVSRRKVLMSRTSTCGAKR